MKIAFIWDGNYPWDIRVEKICLSLINEGHEVHMICRNTRHEKKNEIYQGIYLHRLHCLKRSLGTINKIMNFPFFLNPLWINRINQVVKKEKIEILIVRDITLSIPAIWISKKYNIPIILDMAEPYPEMIRAMWKYEKMGLFDFIIRNPKAADLVEKYTFKNVTHTFAMVKESKKRMIEMGVAPEKISIVSNTPKLDHFTNSSKAYPDELKKIRKNFKIIYIGYLTGSRGLQTVIKGMKLVIAKKPDIRLVIVGSGKSESELKDIVRIHQLENEVVFEGWIDNKKLPAYVKSCDIGLIPHYSCGLWDNTIPNKLFDYMATGIPVICSDVPPMSRIVKKVQCGMVYKDVNSEDFSETVLKMYSSPKMLKEMGSKGIKAVKNQYNWEIDFANVKKALYNLKN